jgi:hypothetical protein
MTHFEKKIFTPLFSPQSADWQTYDRIQRAETHFFCTHFFYKYHSFWSKIMILLRHFHIVTIDGGYCTGLPGSADEPDSFVEHPERARIEPVEECLETTG